MSIGIIISVCTGILFGFLFFPAEIKPFIENASGFALYFLILTVGIELGYNRSVFHRLRILGPKVLLIPLSIVLGSLT
ncbi:MAG TPA: LysO family transporter, partial [Clostridia bacterium]|nr:LysO family transporter [Clostridia bacterium]